MTLPSLVTPAGHEALLLSYFADMLANSASLQTWTGAADETEAEAFVWIDALLGETQITANDYSVIVRAETFTMEREATDTYSRRGVVYLDFDGLIPEADRDLAGEAAYWWSNAIDGILDDLRDVANAGGTLSIVRITRQGPVGRHSRAESAAAEDIGDMLGATYMLEYDSA